MSADSEKFKGCLILIVIAIIAIAVVVTLFYQIVILGHTSGPAGLNSY